jgi:hypothetical protein
MILVWPNDPKKLIPTALNSAVTCAGTAGVSAMVKRPDTKQSLADCIKSFSQAQTDEPKIIITDLGMDWIRLGAGAVDGNWLDADGDVRKAIDDFLSNSANRILFHSGQGLSAETIAENIDATGLRALPIGRGFDAGGGLTSRAASPGYRIADRILQLLSSSPLERAWKNPATQHWFGGDEIIPHTYIDESDFQTKCYNEFSKVFGTVFSESSYSLVFHESLKALAGTCFAGTSTGEIKYALRLGSVALIALLAHQNAYQNGHARHSELNTDAFWRTIPSDLAVRQFIGTKDPDSNRRLAVGLYWLFYKLCEKAKHDGKLERIELMKDGFSLVFSWEAKELFRSLEVNPLSASGSQIEPKFSRPENTTAALRSLGKFLACSPGCIVSISNPYSIDILCPSIQAPST